MSDKLITCLFFDNGQALEAAKFYAATFPNSQVGRITPSPLDAKASDLTVEFTVCGRDFLGLNGGDMFSPTGAVSFIVLTDDQAETDRIWNAILDNGGQENWCGWCQDRWGFYWQITPRALLDATRDTDRAAAKRAMDAMMTMKKIDIATIKKAHAG